MLGNCDSIRSTVMAGHVPAIRSGTSLRQVADRGAGHDEWVIINEKWYKVRSFPWEWMHATDLQINPARA
jgi:hypothetical protein